MFFVIQENMRMDIFLRKKSLLQRKFHSGILPNNSELLKKTVSTREVIFQDILL